jgi:hypothetical protein
MQVDPKMQLLVGRADFALPDVVEANAGASTIVTEVAISTLTLGALTIAAQPDYPRNLRVFITDANSTVTGGTVTVVGQDQNGEPITEVFTLSTAAAATTITGTLAFSKVVSATWALVGGTVTASDDTVAIGIGAAMGLAAAPGAVYQRLIKATFYGGDEAGTFSATYGTYTPAGTLNGAKPLEVLFHYKLPLKW